MASHMLDFYATPGRLTTLAEGEFASEDIQGVIDMVQGLLVYNVVAEPFYGVELTPAQADTIHERDSAALLAVARAVDARPTTAAGQSGRRSMSCLQPDHRCPVAGSRSAGQTWQAWRRGDLDPDQCGLSAIDEHGSFWIAANLRLDLASLNKVEMLPWDLWGEGWEPGQEPTVAQLDLFDEVADLTVNPEANFTELLRRYETDDALRVDGTVINLARDRAESV